MIRAAIATAAVLVATLAFASANCNPSQCQFSLKDASGTSKSYDLSSMCTGTDYSFAVKDFKYVANVCGNTVADCLPSSYTAEDNTGVAIQYFGSTPSCSTPQCKNPSTGTAVCCTAECHVLGTGAPTWSYLDASNPSGGVTATFTPVAVNMKDDPFWCPAEASGSMEPRSVTYNIFCATKAALTGVEAPKMDNYCTVHMNFTSPSVC